MAQIRSKQIADFLSSVQWSTVTSSQIANAADIKSLVSTEIAGANASNSAVSIALSAEISATNSEVIRIDADILDARQYTSDEMLRAQEAEEALQAALTAEINATNSDVTRIDGNVSTEKARALAAELVLTNALSTEIAATNSDVTRIDGNVTTEKGRIDAILLASSADKDSFAEIVSLINAVDTTNDGALAAYVLSNNAALSTEIAATNSDFVVVNASIDSLETALANEISATNTDITNHDTRLTSLEGYIMEDSQELVEVFAIGGLEYVLSKPVQDDRLSHVSVFVNGHRVDVDAVEGKNVRVLTPGYTIDKDDKVVICYQAK